jgi:hypothetical protein
MVVAWASASERARQSVGAWLRTSLEEEKLWTVQFCETRAAVVRFAGRARSVETTGRCVSPSTMRVVA